jgi:serine/alanine adding enzyme
MELVERADIDDKEVSGFVESHPGASLFQTPEFLKVLDRTKDYKGDWAGLRESGELVGSVLFYDITDKTPVPGFTVTRRIVMGGPLVKGENNQEIEGRIKELLVHVIDAGKKPLFVEVRNLSDVSGSAKAFESCDFEFEDHLNFLFDLATGEEGLMRQMSSSGRRMVKKSLSGDLRVSLAKDVSEVDSFFEMLRESYETKALPIADVSLFRACFEVLGDSHCRFLLAKDRSDKIMAGRLELVEGGTMYDWYAASRPEGLSMRPNELLVWSAFQEAIRMGLSRFDFGGAGRPDEKYGVREFKEKFGGRRVNFGRYILITKRLTMQLASKGYELKKKLKARPA